MPERVSHHHDSYIVIRQVMGLDDQSHLPRLPQVKSELMTLIRSRDRQIADELGRNYASEINRTWTLAGQCRLGALALIGYACGWEAGYDLEELRKYIERVKKGYVELHLDTTPFAANPELTVSRLLDSFRPSIFRDDVPEDLIAADFEAVIRYAKSMYISSKVDGDLFSALSRTGATILLTQVEMASGLLWGDTKTVTELVKQSTAPGFFYSQEAKFKRLGIFVD